MKQDEFLAAARQLAVKDGVNKIHDDGVLLFRASAPRPRGAVLYEPQMLFAAQGSKNLYVGDQCFRYDPRHMMVLSIPLPLEGEIPAASKEDPYLAVKISIQPQLVHELTQQMEPAKGSSSPGLLVTPIDDALIDAVTKLLLASKRPQDARILGPPLIREIHYRVLCGPQGSALRALVQGHPHGRHIARVLTQIHGSLEEPWDVNAMASKAHMSASSFFRHFKAVTGMAPLSYIKSLRLHCARSYMLHEGNTASEAAFRVGYASASQFSREFKRLFGRPPSEDLLQNRSQDVQLAWPLATLVS